MTNEELLAKLNELKAQINTKEKKNGRGGIVATILVAVFALVLVVAFSWRAWRLGKKTARLLHEKDRAAEEKRAAETDAELAKEQEKIDAAQERVEEAQSRIEKIDAEVDSLKKQRQTAHERIDAITSWDDVDRITKR